MCPINGSIRNQDLISLILEEVEDGNNETIIINTKKNIVELTNINLRIRYYIDYINQNSNSNEEKYKNKVTLYLNNLKEIYQILPKFVKNENEENESNCCCKSIKYSIAPLVLSIGIVIRVAQRYFSIAVVSVQDIIGKPFFQQLAKLVLGMWESLQIPENYAMAGIDTLLTCVLSYYPFGLKNIISLFSPNESEDKEALNKYLPLEIIIKKLEKQLINKEYRKLEENNLQLKILCNKLQTTIKKHDAFNHLKNELNILDFNTEFTFEQYQDTINLLNNYYWNDLLPQLTQLSATDLKNEDYSFHNVINNSWSNIKFFLTALIINHLVITAASAYTAETLTWETYKDKIISINNIISTVVRGTIMKFVNEYFIKNSLSTLFKPIINYLWPNNNDNSLLKYFKDWVKDQKKLKQAGIFIISFIFTTFITNAIKTYAADVTQNKGDWKKAWIQFTETFPKWGMIASALCVTSSDLYNLTNKMKPALKLRYQEKEQQQIIDEVLSKLSNIISHENMNDSNGENAAGIIRANGDLQTNWESNSIQEIVNNSVGEYVISIIRNKILLSMFNIYMYI
ncbi:hypothetical protein [Spiroplasma endosymbiont of Polydrusus pterygomalis]|uniref:hypothetical protein n=1 Tax=Spiroplasma endosymbiont of Polydrusus pterygomalis TaxID=3139327 RepID=UPI003CCB4B75